MLTVTVWIPLRGTVRAVDSLPGGRRVFSGDPADPLRPLHWDRLVEAYKRVTGDTGATFSYSMWDEDVQGRRGLYEVQGPQAFLDMLQAELEKPEEEQRLADGAPPLEIPGEEMLFLVGKEEIKHGE